MKTKEQTRQFFLDESLNEIKKVSVKGLNNALKRADKPVHTIVIDGTVTKVTIQSAEDAKCQVIVANNFCNNRYQNKTSKFIILNPEETLVFIF